MLEMIHRGLHLSVFLLIEAQTSTLTAQTVQTKATIELSSAAVYDGVVAKTQARGK